ncbi:hypothetical protein SI65_06941 [Aspergillus cristatus]|uniref:AB hydrolase-1 domain-containing protein n=1 Tax=Aspergillus cristatus TaxID=573508 RepID=A0A1E3BA35_ASPCR|nr:hypothetical protein SI65_06941 [Aspergillus cristatus]
MAEVAPQFKNLSLSVDGVDLSVAVVQGPGDPELAPIVCLHGFGSSKEDYYDFAHHSPFQDRPFLAYDAPGCGETECSDLSRISIPFLVRTAEAVLDRVGITTFHLIGHSMGGLTALYLAHKHPDRVRSFVDIEGNLAPGTGGLLPQSTDYHARRSAAAPLTILPRFHPTNPTVPCVFQCVVRVESAAQGASRGGAGYL